MLELSTNRRPSLSTVKHHLQVCILQTATDIISPLLAWLLAAERQFAVRLLQSAQLALYNNYTTGHKYLYSHSEIQKNPSKYM